MDPKLTEMYTNRVLLSEKKNSKEQAKPKEMSGDALRNTKGAVVTSTVKKFDIGNGKNKPVQGTGPGAVKGVVKPKKVTEDVYTGMSKFERIFRKTLSEDVEPTDAEIEGSMSPTVAPEVGANAGEVSSEEKVDGEEGEGEGEGEDEGDIIEDLQDVVTKLQDILQSLGVEGEEEEEEEGENEGESKDSPEDINSDIDNVEAPGHTTTGEGVSESLKDLKSAMKVLKTKFGTLTGKLNKVGGKIKPATGTASTGDGAAGKALSKNTSLQSKSSMHVTSHLKPGKGLFEKRSQR